MKEEGASLHKIRKETKHSFKTIKKYLEDNTVKENKPIKDEISINKNEGSIVESTQVKNEPPKIIPQPNPISITTEFEPEIIIESLQEATAVKPDEAIVEVRGVPIGKKISFTPKNLTMWEWFTSSYQGWENTDISDFINECMDFYFKKGLGAKMKIEVVQEVA